MLPAPLFATLNALLAEQTAARGHLARHAGKVLGLRLGPLPLTAAITETGGFEATGDGAVPDCEILLGPALLVRLAAGDREAMNASEVRGDGLLAADFKRALEAVDLALMLQPFLGDIAAARVADGLTGLLGWRQAAALSAAGTVAEYLVYESPALASRTAVAGFVHEVDALRDATARLEARVAQLENAVSAQAHIDEVDVKRSGRSQFKTREG